jgi:uncharacterized protein YdaU (DUF1376 family)
LTKKPMYQAAPQRPFFKCFPSDLIAGCMVLSPEEKAVYYTLLMLMYDKWAPVDDRTKDRRAFLAGLTGLSPRKFFVTRDALIDHGKLFRDHDGLLSNRRFERERARISKGEEIYVDTYVELIPPEKGRLKSEINTDLNEATLNNTNALGYPPYARESRVQTLDSTVQAPALSEGSEEIIESEIQQICKAIGVDLRSSTLRAGWPHRWVTMRTQLNLTVGDMVKAIESYGAQLKGEQVRSLGLYRDRAVEMRVARELDARLSGRADAKPAHVPTYTREQWFDKLKLFLHLGLWQPSQDGPSPIMPGCVAPGELLDLAEAKWIKQGNHPEMMRIANYKDPWQPNKVDVFKQAAPFAPRERAGKQK